MVEILFWVFVGALIGWNLPQPIWAVWVQNWVVGIWKTLTGQNKAE